MAAAKILVSVDYEVFGTVQGVFFRKYTHEQATRLGLVGWVKNTSQGTVVGTVQGQEPRIKQMKEWLATTGSPKSKIQKCEFSTEKDIESCNYDSFEIDRPKRRKKKTR